jgi:integration host factor subunit beta
MNKSDLVDYVAQKLNLPRKKAETVVNTVFDTMAETLVDGGRIEIRGFGSFVSKNYEEYQGRNPRTGDPIHVAPKRLPFFKVGKELREIVNASAGS